jgi:type IV pilus assembly protein PilE
MKEGGSMQRQAGFTLIELMITMVVLAILAAIAIPSYTDYITRGKLPEATTALQAQKTKMEQYFQDNRNYPNAVTPCTTGAPGVGQIQVPQLQYFTMGCTTTNTAYTITATGNTGGSLEGITYSIDQTNNRQTQIVSGSPINKKGGYAPGIVNCWVSRKPNLC